MGEPLLIKDLAEQMIRFYGYEPEKEIPIVTIGLRKGEKLKEALWEPTESIEPTGYPKINRILRNGHVLQNLPQLLESLRPICFFDPTHPELYRNRRRLREILKQAIPTLEIPPDEPEY